MAESDNVLTKMHDLLLYALPQIGQFPRDQKFILGDRIETRLLEVQERCIRAYYSRDKRAHLTEANLTLEVVRHLVRLCLAMKLLPAKRFETLSRKVDEVGRMIGGWLKQALRPSPAQT